MRITILSVIIFFSVIVSGQTVKLLSSDSLYNYVTYKKVEAGIILPDSVETAVNNFINNSIFGSLHTPVLNPFDPDDINVKADIYKRDSSGWNFYKTCFGFFYREFKHNNLKTGYIPVYSKYRFRIRFTPRDTGEYKLQLSTIIKKKDTLTSGELLFTVNPNPSGNSGDFLRIVNHHFLSTGDKSFFPVGHNLPFPRDPVVYEWTNPHKTITPKGYEQGLSMIKFTKATGQNFLRVLMTPWAFDIEFEKLNNYYDRLSNAWELDRFIEKAGEKNIRILLNLQIHYSLENGNSYAINQWDFPPFTSYLYKCGQDPTDMGYCYSKIDGVTTAFDFFTNETAKNYYKKRLRYIVARWGYSPAIAWYELFSEINQATKTNEIIPRDTKNKYAGCKASPLKASVYESKPWVFGKWQSEMAAFIKDSLMENNHLIGVSYSGKPTIKDNNNRGDSSYFDKNIDIISYNRYTLNVNKVTLPMSVDYLTDMNPHYYFTGSHAIQKPLIFSEFGSTGYHSVDRCGQNIFFIKDIWFSAVSGLCGAGLRWDMQNNENNSWIYLNDLKLFMDSVDLTLSNWETYWDERYDNLAEMSCLKNKSYHRAVGAISNKTLNFYTLCTDTTTNCYRVVVNDTAGNILKHELRTALTVYPKTGAHLKISHMGVFRKYKIEWYDVVNRKSLGHTEIRTNIVGELKLRFPVMTAAKPTIPLIAFKATSVK